LIALQAEIDAAHREVASGAPADTLDARFDAIEALISGSNSDISALEQEIREAHLTINNVEGTLDSRFDAIDGGTVPSRTLPDIITEVNGARSSYGSINARLN